MPRGNATWRTTENLKFFVLVNAMRGTTVTTPTAASGENGDEKTRGQETPRTDPEIDVYSYPSLRIWELARSVLPPKNQGELIQLTLLNGTVVVTVIVVPAVAVAGLGDTVTLTPGTATPEA